MSRFLTPAKMGLLVLIQLYVEGAVPDVCAMHILSFLSSHLIESDHVKTPRGRSNFPSISRWARAEATIGLVISIRDFEKLFEEDSIPEASSALREVWYKFLAKLWAIDSLDALHAFFESLPPLLAKTKEEERQMREAGQEPLDPDFVRLSRNSPFGQFVRKSHLEFSRMRFHDSSELWKSFVKYRHDTAGHWRRRNPGFSRLSFDNVLLIGQEEWGPEGLAEMAGITYGEMLHDQDSTLPVSTDDIHKLLEFQVEKIEKYGNRLPTELRLQLQDLLVDSYMVPSLSHYANFMDAWRTGDYPTAFDYLHRYFDYTIQSRDRLFYQYALMNLAIVQSDFGCHKEAVAAMLEAVSTARENRDMKCLNFALNWLFQFGHSHPQFVAELEANNMLGGKESLAFLREKAKETGMYSLWSSAIWSEAKAGLENGESVATATELMVRSSQNIIEKNLVGCFAAQFALNISLWERLGLSSLASMACTVFLHSHRENSKFEDELKIVARLAMSKSRQGQWPEAMQLLKQLDENALRSWRPRNLWIKYGRILKLQEALHVGDLDVAEHLVHTLLESGSEDLEPDLKHEIDALHVEYLIQTQNLQVAFEKVSRLLDQARKDGQDIRLRIQLMLLKGKLFELADRPQKGFSMVVKAASMSWRARLIPLLWQSLGSIAIILNSLSEFQAAEELLNTVLPRALECDDTLLCANLYRILADSLVGWAGTQEKRSESRNEGLVRAVCALKKAEMSYAALGNVRGQTEMLAKQATIAKLRGQHKEADMYAAEYLSLRSRTQKLVEQL